MTDSTAVNPTQALSGAAQMSSTGDAMLKRWRALRARIDHLNASQPWGNDEPGRNFNKNYLEGDNPPCTSVLEGGESMVIAVSKLGEQIREGVQGVVDVDDLTAQWFKK
ncbi:hypothetical protein [Dactylosporangium matsuzakiense]|uniref:Uncharacterized protein n=1 Tax=Dactylosporangium matsuzakiense TaxID=53360 RepID=A0A9W6KVW6_9ACTN|nr:hypothetical protein [Dactylosporangium matsuzakiense]UWZ45970.1 hypothetical protein Dmats_05755 [Dactylosporangium matsuzakiense]GLL07551.1 hypothetical protein GCM10017581_093050 [Dactylosporangium matsuzakiense]